MSLLLNNTLQTVLSSKYEHERDKHIKYFDEDHRYVIDLKPDVAYTSVTTWVHTHFEPFDADEIIKKMMSGKKWKKGYKYWGMTPSQIKELWVLNASLGTQLHYEIECFNNNRFIDGCEYTNKELYENYMSINGELLENTSIEWQYFINFIKEYPHLKPYRTEWTIFNEDIQIAGSIDMVYENPDGSVSIYDWKRSTFITRINTFNKFSITPHICHLPDSNFWHYALQLNIYKYILETKYNKIVNGLYLVRLHPECDNNFELIELPVLTIEINDLIQDRLKSCVKS